MGRIRSMAVVFALAACGKSHAPDSDAGTPVEDAGGPCTADAQAAGCPCETTGDVVPCYDGPAGTEGVGACEGGVRVCTDGAWGTCDGQVLPIDERCNGLDDDCDGDATDDPVLPCGDCDAACDVVGFGPAETRPFDDPAATLDGATLAAEGSLVRGGFRAPRDVLWSPSADSYAVSRVDTLAREVVGTYRASFEASSVQPVVAAVDYEGNAFFGNRALGLTTSVTKVHYECVDVDRDGALRTSHGPDEILEFEDDECVPWRSDLTCDGGGFATCEEARSIAYEMRVDEAIQERLWVGTRQSDLRELDAITGEETDVTASCSPCQSDGAAVDRDGFLWVNCGSALCRIETRDPETVDRFDRAEGGSQDLTIDPEGRIWTAGNVARFEPALEEWTLFADEFGHGVSATAEGEVYVGACPLGDVSGTFCRIDGVTDEVELIGGQLRVLAVDARGLVWGFRASTFVFDPASGEVDDALDCGGDPCISGPWHQSDITGTQLAQATDAPGGWRVVVEGCPAGQTTTWRRLDWEADTADDAAVRLEARAAGSRETLAIRAWTTIDGPAPFDLGALGLDQSTSLLEIRATLAANPGAISPVLHAVRVHRHCE